MKERHEKFIELLTQKEQFIPVHEWAKEMQVSEKTLHRDIKTINQELLPTGAFIEKKAGVGIRLNLEKSDKEAFFNRILIREEGRREYREISWNRDYRRLDIALNFLLYTDEETVLSDLAYKYYVSRSSITNDVKAVETFLVRQGLSLERGKRGIAVRGKEEDIRVTLTDLIIFLLDASSEQDWGRNFEADIMMTILDCFSEADLSSTERLLRNLEEEENYYFDEREYGRISVGILVLLYRNRQGFHMEKEEQGPDRKGGRLYSLAKKLVGMLETESGTEIPDGEEAFLWKILSETHLSSMCREKKEGEDSGLTDAFARDFIDAFSVIMEVNLREESSLYQNVMSHISFMIKRVSGNTQARNPLAPQILEEYTEVTNICQIICWILAKKFSLPEISMDEICYLALYIQGEIMEKEENAEILLVSNQPKGIVNLMRHKLLTRHSKWKITECSYYSFFSQETEKYDFVISTQVLEGKERDIPCACISPMLDGKDWKTIETMSKYAREQPEWYLQKLAGTLTDLKDIGCRVEVTEEDLPFIPGVWSIQIEGLKQIQYLYTYRKGGGNICRFSLDGGEGRIRSIGFEMGNWDFMLFASKLIYYLGSCSSEVAAEFSKFMLEERKTDV